MHYTKQTITSFIHQAGILVYNSKHVDDIKNAVMQYGYDERRLDDGEQVFKMLKEISFKQHQAKSDKMEKFKLKQDLQSKIHKEYMKYLKIARIAFAEDFKARNVLILDGGRERTYKEWYFQVSVFCSIMLKNDDGYQDRMAQYGIEVVKIEDLRKQLVKLNEVNDECIKSAAELKRLTAQRKKMVIKMQNYVSDFIKIARIALEHSPKALQSLGVGVNN
ncbi:hypothetical protein [Carboxylicivirga linearis]|uniref:Uncharacterized protein n=1 Tax=Carboxylicivirga linearis TaxID=1628157 RepID=A0ABS5JS58_9BACT|nr:hypothetical protein [Carboxylicivirga linearis]MBS2097647.1 hypothetical protein [Carboxylicivirga linearis]